MDKKGIGIDGKNISIRGMDNAYGANTNDSVSSPN